MVGGTGTLVGPVVGCVAIQWLTAQLGTQETINANLVLGAILMATVLLLAKGVVPSAGIVVDALIARRRKTASALENSAKSTEHST